MNIWSRRGVLCLFYVLCTITIYGQTYTADAYTCEQLGSIYYAYPEPKNKQTPPPKGYDAFYISHYGRHGSRWITSDERYTNVISVFESHELTSLGEDVKQRLYKVWEDAQGRSGDLTPLGEHQHREIAERLYGKYPKIFDDKAYISARSSTAVRCIMSMSAFCERLKELNPSLKIVREVNQRYMSYIAYTSPQAEEFCSHTSDWRKDFYDFESKHILPQRLISSLFEYPEEIRQPHELMMGLYWIASDMQNVDLSLSFYDIFTKEELFGIWQSINYRMYVCNAAAPLNKGIMPKSATSLLKNIIESANKMIQEGHTGATLRFGHDTFLIRLLALMEIEGCSNRETETNRFYLAWQDFKVSPMAANLQIVFFRNKEGNVIVKFLHNENEVQIPIKSVQGPYYNWDKVKSFYTELIEQVN